MDQTFLYLDVIFPISQVANFGDALHGETKLAQVVTGDVQNDAAVVKVGGVATTVAKRDRPSAWGDLIPYIQIDLRKNKNARNLADTSSAKFGLWILDRWPLVRSCIENKKLCQH